MENSIRVKWNRNAVKSEPIKVGIGFVQKVGFDFDGTNMKVYWNKTEQVIVKENEGVNYDIQENRAFTAFVGNDWGEGNIHS